MHNYLRQNCRFFEIYWRNTTASTETFTEKQILRNGALYFTSYISIALSRILPHLKPIKNAKKLQEGGKNNPLRLSTFYNLLFFETLIARS